MCVTGAHNSLAVSVNWSVLFVTRNSSTWKIVPIISVGSLSLTSLEPQTMSLPTRLPRLLEQREVSSFRYQQFNFGVASKQLTLDLWRTSTRDFLKRPCRFRKLIAGSESFWLRLIFFFRSLIHGTLIISCGLSFTQKQTTVLSITFIPWGGRPSIADLPRNWIGWNDASFFNDPSVIMKSI